VDANVTAAAETESRALVESWGSLRWLASRKLGNAQGLTLGRVLIRKGRSNPRHAHGQCEEALYLLRGRLEHTVGAEKVVLAAGDTLVIPPGVFHNATALGDEDADMIVAYSSGARDFVPEKPG
jgi:putative monooxygenase